MGLIANMLNWRGRISAFALLSGLCAVSFSLAQIAHAGEDSGHPPATTQFGEDSERPPAMTQAGNVDTGTDSPVAEPVKTQGEQKPSVESEAGTNGRNAQERKSEEAPARPSEPAGWHVLKGAAIFRSAPGAEIKETAQDRLQLDRGEVVIEPSHPIVVITPLAETHLMHRSAVLFRVQRGSERCEVLWDNGPDSVILISQRTKLNLGPGEEALVTDHDPNYREITESDDIGRRKIKLHELARHHHVVTAEFSLMHALQRDPLLYDLSHSKDKRDVSLREHILKTATVLNYVTRNHGYYATTSGF